MLWATEKLMKYVVEYYPDLAQATRSRRFSAVCNMFNLAVAAKELALASECFDEIKELRAEIIRNAYSNQK